MGIAESLTGQIPTIVAGGVALKFTKAALGEKKKVSYPKNRAKGRRLSNKYNPF